MRGSVIASCGTGCNCEFNQSAATVSVIIPEAGLELVDSRYVVDDLLELLTVRVPRSTPTLPSPAGGEG